MNEIMIRKRDADVYLIFERPEATVSNEASVMKGQFAMTRVDKYGQFDDSSFIALSFICVAIEERINFKLNEENSNAI